MARLLSKKSGLRLGLRLGEASQKVEPLRNENRAIQGSERVKTRGVEGEGDEDEVTKPRARLG